MEPPKVVKIVAAFVAGVVVALGSALIYVRANDLRHPEPISIIQIPAKPAAAPAAAETSTPPVSVAAPETVPPSVAPPVHQAVAPVPIVRPKKLTAARKPQPRIPVAQLAQNHPLYTPPPYTPASAAAAVPASSAVPAASTTDQAPPPATYVPQEVQPVAPIRQPHVVTLTAGTAVTIRLAETVSTDHNYTGDTFRGTLESPIIMDGFIIVDRGSKVLGRVVNSEKAGRVEGVADLNLTLTELNTTDGQRLHVDTSSLDRKGSSSMGQDAAKIAGGAALGAVIGAVTGGGKGAGIGAGVGGAAGTGVVLATRGKASIVPVESKLTFRLATPLTITEKFNP